MTDSTSTLRVLVVEDNPKVRNGLVALLDGSPGFACAGACATAEAALQQATTAKPDLILVDLELPGQSGTDFLRACRQRFPTVELLVLTVHDGAEWIFPALASTVWEGVQALSRDSVTVLEHTFYATLKRAEEG